MRISELLPFRDETPLNTSYVADSATSSFVSGYKCLRRYLTVALLAGAAYCGAFWPEPRHPQTATEIFRGVTYGCDRLERTAEGSGLVHWVRIMLAAPGLELYVTGLDGAAVAQGWQYRLRYVQDVLVREHLSVAINGALFTSNSRWLRWSGDLARGVETVIADHVVSHVWEHTYLLWFDEELTPHLNPAKPPSAAELASAKWGIGGQAVWLHNGKVWPGSGRTPDARTAVAIDQQRRILFFAVAEQISPRLLLERLAALGAQDGILLDGGGSSSMAVGKGAKGIRPGVLYGGARPVATYVGIRARPL